MEASNPTVLKTRLSTPSICCGYAKTWRRIDSSCDYGLFVQSLRFLAVLAVACLLTGCGSQTDSDTVAQTSAAQTSAAQTSAAQTSDSATVGPDESGQLQPTEVVSQFLDRVRRGGQEASSSELLTKLAQQELTRIGRPFEFPGSPDTVFEVRQAFPVPDQDDAVWVHTYLVEPGDSGQNFQYEVVWTLRKESEGWRVSGFAIDQGDGMEPLEFDFENGDEMAARLAALEGAEGSVNR
ncbi:hypothetical protein Mal15_51870 [Stieleria maiorica]|uniref:Uncharacterized protein n=1 Tax=Stieleria maiorica TaxID=2795974 RepID=A0A5B9MM62_9BACT|nr:hypothetical protein [Stieleria maiorica]QEG01111.1 hypothetical protein Mal15_51870 [Stieleria maiorica]